LLSKEEESKQTRLEQKTSKKKAMSVRNLATHRHDAPSSPSTLKKKAKSFATHHHDTPSPSSLSDTESVTEGGEKPASFLEKKKEAKRQEKESRKDVQT
jgi:hypothetical protein